MPFHNNLECESYQSRTDMSTRQYHIVDISSGNVAQVNLAAAGGGYGIAMNHPNSGEMISVAVQGQSRVRCGEAIAIGQYITAAASGYAAAVGSAATTTAKIMGRMIVGAASGSVGVVAIDKLLIVGSATTF